MALRRSITARRLATLVPLLGLLAGSPTGVRAETAQDALERGDYAAAADLWETEAAAGSAEAMLSLGLLHDLGLGVPRDPAEALRWYLAAAAQGSAEAQLNVAVMYDSGIGVPSDPATAATWYARAAANGQPRARYNLAQLYERGVGVPPNPGLARAWYAAAAEDLAAAAERLAQLPPADEAGPPGPPPLAVDGIIRGTPRAPRAELVWTAEPGRGAFRVQVARGAAQGSEEARVLIDRGLDVSAVTLDLPAGSDDLAWRVGRGDDAVAWGPWRPLSRTPQEQAPSAAPDAEPPADALTAEAAPPDPADLAAQLHIVVNQGDEVARSFADELSEAYARGGLAVSIQTAEQPALATTVEYAHEDDAALAAAVAELLPRVGREGPLQVEGQDAAPGLVTLRLVGGPRDLADPSEQADATLGAAAGGQPSASQSSSVPGRGTGR